jgi:hypothetical protein
MPSFLQTAHDKAHVILDRERPFFTPGAMSMYVLALIAEAPVIIARYLLALLIVFAVLVIEGNLHGGTEWALVALIPTVWSAVALFNPTGGAWWWQTRAGGGAHRRWGRADGIKIVKDTPGPPDERSRNTRPRHAAERPQTTIGGTDAYVENTPNSAAQHISR